ncbi:MAG: hypothetical protein BMS9Abin29_0192 [Gemmatimonadota bacterium]|nr:MAG: hypothetical protein BMS9Abin29_0192 [Gemmatimonadota bacterium]
MDFLPLATQADLRAALSQEWAVLYKHSNRCWVCFLAIRQVRRFAESNPGTPVYQVDAIEGREVSKTIAQSLEIPHQSPQAFVLNSGRVVWHDSHFGIKARLLSRARGGT